MIEGILTAFISETIKSHLMVGILLLQVSARWWKRSVFLVEQAGVYKDRRAALKSQVTHWRVGVLSHSVNTWQSLMALFTVCPIPLCRLCLIVTLNHFQNRCPACYWHVLFEFKLDVWYVLRFCDNGTVCVFASIVYALCMKRTFSPIQKWTSRD